MNNQIEAYINGIAKSTFCKGLGPACRHVDCIAANPDAYVSLAHFVSVQPRECMFVKDEFMPDGMIYKNNIYMWYPTPGKGDAMQAEYAKTARNRIKELVAECPSFNEVIIDIRNNIGGILSTFINAVLPFLLCNDKFANSQGEYMYGIGKDGKTKAKFTIENNTHRIILSSHGELFDDSLDDDLIPIEDIEKVPFVGKKIHVLCNKYTMSSGEIVCILMRKLGHTIYGEPTRGLTNGNRQIISGSIKSALIPYYMISDGKTIYKHGITPDKRVLAL